MVERDGWLFYTVRQQDNSLVIMRVVVSPEMERYVRWVEAYEGNDDLSIAGFSLKETV